MLGSHDVRSPYIVVCDRTRFFGKNPDQAKNGTKTGFLDIIKNHGISFVWNCCKTNILVVHWHYVKSTCLGKIWISSYSQKWLSANEISVFFNFQYFINRLISDFDFWHVDRNDWKEQGLITGFLKKVLIWANGRFGAQNEHLFDKEKSSIDWMKTATSEWWNTFALYHFVKGIIPSIW